MPTLRLLPTRGGRLEVTRAKRLEALRGWTWTPKDDAWEAAFRTLGAFAEEHGHASPPKELVVDGLALGKWVSQERHRARKRARPDRVARLESLPGWTWDTRRAKWEQRLEILRSYAREHGHALVPAAAVYGGEKLGSWVVQQRVRHRAGRLSAGDVSLLEAIPGWAWDARDAEWERAFQVLAAYAREHGAAQPRQGLTVDGVNLGNWVSVQRSRFRAGDLDDLKVRRLQSLAGWSWHTRNEAWDRAIELLRIFAEREGHAQVPARHEEGGFRLGAWVGNVRSRGRRGLLAPDRARQLEDIPGWSWHVRRDRWEDGFRALITYSEREGHTAVPVGHKEGAIALGQWVARQRQQYSNGLLSGGRADRLMALPGWRWRFR